MPVVDYASEKLLTNGSIVKRNLQSLNDPSISCQRTLRAIGDVLDLLHVRSFEIKLDGKGYVVQGMSEKVKDEIVVKAIGLKKFVEIFRLNRIMRPEGRLRNKAPKSFMFSGMRFSEQDLDRLELSGRARRLSLDTASGPTPYRLSQILRALGAHIDGKRARLITVSMRDTQVTVCSELPSGEQVVEEFNQINLYDLWVHRYKLRKDSFPGKTPMLRTG